MADPGVTDLADIDLMQSDLVREGFPHEIFTTLRREAPVWWHPMPEGLPVKTDDGFWVLSKYDPPNGPGCLPRRLINRMSSIGGAENAADMERPLSTPPSHVVEAG